MRAAVLALLAGNSGLLCSADDGSDESGNTGGSGSGGGDETYDASKGAGAPDHPEKFPRTDLSDANDREFTSGLDGRLHAIEARLAKLEAVPMVEVGDIKAHPALKLYEDLHALVMETRGHVDQISREVTALRRG